MTENKYDAILREGTQNSAVELRQNIISASDTNPDEAAKASQLSRQFGVPQVAVEQDISFYEKEKNLPMNKFDKLAEMPLSIQEFMANIDNAKIIHDDVGALLYTYDKTRSLTAEIVQFGSSVLGGFGGQLKDVSKLAAEGHAKGQQHGYFQGPLDRILGPLSIGTAYTVGSILDFASAEGLDKAAEFIRPPEERRDFVDQIFGGLGQISAQLLFLARNPAAATASFYAQSAENMQNRLDAAGVNDPETRLSASIPAGVVGAATERVPLGLILNRVPGMSKLMGSVPKALQKKWLETTFEIGTAAGAEAAQEGIQGFLEDLIVQQTFNPDQKFFETLHEEMAVGGIVGGIAKTVILAITGGRRASTYQYQKEQAENLRSAFTEAKQAGEATNLLARDPEKFKEFLSTANAEGQDITLDGTFVEELYQSGIDTEAFFEIVPEARAQFAESEATGSDIRLPADKVVFAMAQDQENALDFIRDFVKLEEGLSPRQADDPEFVNAQIEDILEQARQEQASFENEAQAQEFYERIEQQVADNLMDTNRLGEKSRTPDAARQEAALYASFAKTLVERGGDSAQAVLENVFGANFSIRGPQPPPPSLPITGEDAYIDSLRKAEKAKAVREAKRTPVKDLLGKVKPKREKATPTPLINMLIDRGKIKRGSPIAAELESAGITTKTHPRLFAKDGALSDIDNLVQQEVESELGVSGVFTPDESGYIDRQQLIDLIRDETFGNFIQTDEEVAQGQQQAYDEQVLDELSRRGVDIIDADNDTVKRTLQEAAADYASGTYFQEGSDGDQFFDDDALERAKNQPDGSRERLVYLSPKQFLEMAKDDMPDNQKTKTVNDLIESEVKFESIPQLDFLNNGDGTAKVVGHEGRHRARALMIKAHKIPVIITSREGGDGQAIRWGKQSGNNPDVIDGKWPETLIGEGKYNNNKIEFPVEDLRKQEFFQTATPSGKMILREAGFGTTQLSNGDIAFVGGLQTEGLGTPGTARLRYSIFDMQVYKEQGAADADSGFVEINIAIDEDGNLTDTIEGLVNIEINKDKRGNKIAQRSINALLSNAQNGELKIYDIQKKAKGFWENLGIEYTNKQETDGVIKGTHELYQDRDGKRGSIQFGEQGQRVINLFEGADESTFFHETGHLFLDIFGQIAADPNASQEIKDEYQKALDWLGVESADQIGTEQHEKWARGFEAYLYEGKGPSEKLRGVFDRFKIWLINVYKNVKTLDVKLDDNIRGVFDRLLATDSEIEALKDNTLFRPNEQTLEMLNATERAKYIRQQERAISEAKNKLFRKALRQKRRENAKWYKEERAKVQADEEQILQSSGLYRAMQIVTTGKDFQGETVFDGEHRISESDVTELYGNKEILKYLPRGSRVKGDGVDLKILAEMFGFKNPKDMIDTMINADPYKLRLQKNTDAEMIRRHGDMLNDGTIERESLETVMAQSPELNMTELESLQRRTGEEYPSDGDFKIAAKRAISEQKLDHSIKPDKYYRAALKAEREYGKALANEEFEAAAAAKRRVILNKHMYREARDARMEVDKALKKFQKLSKQPPKKKKPVIDPDYHEKIWDALGAYQLGPRLTDQKRMKLELSAINEWIQAQEQDEFAQLLIPPEILAAQEKTHYRDLTLNEFRGLRDLVTNLETQGRRKLQYIREGEKRDLNELIDELELSAAQHNKVLEKPLSKREDERLSKRIGQVAGAIDAVNTKAQLIMSQLDGGEFGIWTRSIFEPIQAAEIQKNIRSREEMKNLQNIIDKHYGKDYRKKRARLKLDSKKGLADKESYVQTFMEEEFTVTDGEVTESLTREMILTIATHQGAADNQVKLLDGYAKTRGWTKAFIDDALAKMTKRDWEFVVDVWDFNDSFWNESSKIEAKRFGYAPEKIEHQPLTVTTSDGHTLNLKGGYNRIKYDRNQDTQVEKEAIAEVMQDMMVGASARAQTKNGSMNERVDNVERPIRLDLDVISEHANEQIAFITMSEAVENANKILRKQRVQEAMHTYLGPEMRLMMELWLQDTASGGVMAGGILNRSMRAMRSNYTLGRLGLRPMTALLQFSGLAQTAGDVGTANMTRGLIKVFSTGNPYAISNEIKAKSALMREREFTLTRDVADAVKNLTKPGNSWIHRKAALMLWPMQKMQEIVDAVTWTANYQKAIREGFDDADAIRQADIALSRTQGSGLVSDLAAIERGTLNEQTQRQEWVKLATVFFSYFNAKYNVIKGKHIQYKNQQIGRTDLAVSYIMTFMLEGLISSTIMGQLYFDSDDDDEISGSEIAMTIAGLTINQGTSSIPFVRTVTGAKEGFTAQGAAQAQLQNVGSFLDKLQDTGEKILKGDLDEVNWYAFSRGAINATNAFLPIPAGMTNQILRAAEKESEGDDATIMDYMVYRKD